MLNLFLRHSKYEEAFVGKRVVDGEALFMKIDHIWNDIDRKLVATIENGKLHDDYFIDRFGYKLPLEFLSTGCKLALIVNHYQSTLVDLRECGNNARDAIIWYIKNGNICVRYNDITVAYPKNIDSRTNDLDISVSINGRFDISSLEKLNYTLMYDLYSPDSDIISTYEEG